MELVAELGRTLAFAYASGVNLYATVALLGLAARYDWVALPPQFSAFDNPWVIGVALGLYLVEFFADKIPWVDTAWDMLHTVIRPIGGALVAVTTLGEATPAVQAVIGLAGGTIAAGSHFTKAGTRAAVNTSPEPFSNWTLSLLEDVFVIGLGVVALQYPVVALAVAVAAIVATVVALVILARWMRRRFGPAAPSGVPATR
jgi:hypothetical protein